MVEARQVFGGTMLMFEINDGRGGVVARLSSGITIA